MKNKTLTLFLQIPLYYKWLFTITRSSVKEDFFLERQSTSRAPPKFVYSESGTFKIGAQLDRITGKLFYKENPKIVTSTIIQI